MAASLITKGRPASALDARLPLEFEADYQRATTFEQSALGWPDRNAVLRPKKFAHLLSLSRSHAEKARAEVYATTHFMYIREFVDSC